ncbi:MAG: NDP-sugar synthase [Nanoarchaeota archaeon]|nr:NDP-sugar synthase [Nanoarchaeota archaeon]
MKGLILVGGYGTRLEPLTLRTPKALLPVGGKANITYIIDLLKGVVDEIVISANEKQKKMKDFLKGYKFVFEPTNYDSDKLGAIRAIHYAVNQVGMDDYVVVGGDNWLYGLDMKEFVKNYQEKKPHANIALFWLEDKSLVKYYGIAVLEGDRIVGFQEKPKVEEAKSRLASTMVYAINKEFLEKYLPEYIESRIRMGLRPDIPGELWQHYADRLFLMGTEFKGHWGDIGKPKTYIETNKIAMNYVRGNVSKEAEVNAKLVGNGIVIKDDVRIEEGVRIKGPAIIEENVEIGKNAIIGPYTHIMHDSKIGEGSMIEGSIVFERVEVGEYVRTLNCVIDGEVKIGDDARIEDFSIIGFGSEIGEDARILSHSRIWPFVRVNNEAVIKSDVIWPIVDTKLRKRLLGSKYWE